MREHLDKAIWYQNCQLYHDNVLEVLNEFCKNLGKKETQAYKKLISEIASIETYIANALLQGYHEEKPPYQPDRGAVKMQQQIAENMKGMGTGEALAWLSGQRRTPMPRHWTKECQEFMCKIAASYSGNGREYRETLSRGPEDDSRITEERDTIPRRCNTFFAGEQ